MSRREETPHPLRRTSGDDLSVGRHLGEAIALLHDRKISDTGAGKGYHWRAITTLRVYCGTFHPGMAALAAHFEGIRAMRNMIDYPDGHRPTNDEEEEFVQSYGASQAQLWLTVADRLVNDLVPRLEATYKQRHPAPQPKA